MDSSLNASALKFSAALVCGFRVQSSKLRSGAGWAPYMVNCDWGKKPDQKMVGWDYFAGNIFWFALATADWGSPAELEGEQVSPPRAKGLSCANSTPDEEEWNQGHGLA